MAGQEAFVQQAEDFAWCEQVVKTNSATFYRAFSQLPPDKRNGVFAVYAFCRTADDCADRDASLVKLNALRRDLAKFMSGDPLDEPLWRALDVVFSTYEMRDRPFFDMLEGQRRDLSFRQPQTMADLEEYAYYVAGSVGCMLLPLLRAQAPISAALNRNAISLGVAMQLTNVLRDVGEDWRAGRVYLPANLMACRSYGARDFSASLVSNAFVDAWEEVAWRAEDLYRPMECGIDQLDEDSRMATLSSLFLYRGILDAVRDEEYQCFDRRAAVSSLKAAELVSKAQRQLNMQ